VLYTEPRETVVCGHKEVLATDASLIVKWRLVTDYRQCIPVPQLLRIPGQFPPGGQGAKVYSLVLHLQQGPWESWSRTFTKIALAVPVIISKVADRTITVLEGHGRYIPGHSS